MTNCSFFGSIISSKNAVDLKEFKNLKLKKREYSLKYLVLLKILPSTNRFYSWYSYYLFVDYLTCFQDYTYLKTHLLHYH